MVRVLLAASIVAAMGSLFAVETQAAGPQLAHMVYFKLKDDSPEAREKLIAGCKTYLKGHDGTVFFSVGGLAPDMQRDVNDRDFDVALVIVFENKAAHDKYQDHPRHNTFIEQLKPNWAKVRVFDSYLSAD
jgi:hypothetical protein